ncbi:MAG: AAA family ATPase, partial [Candidatus Brocadiales bacterium]|nr:AAA family ATPase [Candidatus Bathyanammoxibius sp.]
MYLVSPLVVAGQPTLFFGDGGSTKSMLAAFMSVLTTANVSALGWDVEPATALYLDWEDSADEYKERIRAISTGLNITPPQVLYRRCTQSLINDLENIQRIVVEKKIGFIVIDSAAYAVGGDPLVSQFVTDYFNALRGLGVSSLTIAHQPKNLEKTKTPFGSTFWTNAPRSVWQVRKTQDGEDEVVTGLFHTKANRGRLKAPIGLSIRFSGADDRLESVTFSLTDLAKTDLSTGLNAIGQITPLLKQLGPLTVAEIAAELSMPHNTVRGVANRYRDKLLKKGSNDKWGLILKNPPPPPP